MCDHSETEDDISTGDTICTICAMVVDKIYMAQSSFVEFSKDKPMDEWRTFYKNTCEAAAINEGIVDEACQYLKTLCLDESCKKIKKKHLAAFALYEITLRNEMGREPHEIAYFCDVPSSKLLEVEKCVHFKSLVDKSEFYIQRYAYYLDLSYCDVKMIKGIMFNMYGNGAVRPKNLAAAVTYLYCNQKKMRKTMKNICQVFGSSITSVGKIIRDLKPKYAESIDLLYS
jgi:transcription initiation factor TFIIIB Brf1 subunit/transcription initiation factor TFIIB